MGHTGGSESSKVAGIAATAIFHVALLLVCLSVWLGRNEDTSHQAEIEDEDPEITFEEVVDLVAGGSYVEAEFAPPEPDPKLSVGSNVEAAPPLPPEPTQEGIMQQKRDSISNRVSFNTPTITEEKGDGGDAPATVASTDVDTSYELVGFSPGHFERPRGKLTGVISIRITVDSDGKVLSAEFYGPRSDYDIIKDPAAKDNCIAAAKKSNFIPDAVIESKTTTGFLIYRF